MTSETQSLGTAGKLKRQLLPLHQHHLALEQGSYCKERTFIKINKDLMFNIIIFKKHNLSITVSKVTTVFNLDKKRKRKNPRSFSTENQPSATRMTRYSFTQYLSVSSSPASRMQPSHTQVNLCKHLTTLFFWLHSNHTKKCIERW